MNLTKFAVICVIICLPMNIILGIKIMDIEYHEKLEQQYQRAVSNAVNDGVLAMKIFSEDSLDDEHKKDVSLDSVEVVNAFLASYDYGFAAYSDNQQHLFERYIVALVLVDYDGYYIYGTQRSVDSNTGITTYKRILSEKQPYLYMVGNSFIYLTLGDEVSIINHLPGGIIEERWGEYKEPEMLSLLPSDFNVNNYESLKKYYITSMIESSLSNAVACHNEYTQKYDFNYKFHIPVYDKDMIGECLEDVSLLSFIQIPLFGTDEVLELNDLSKRNVQSGKKYYGYEQVGVNGASNEFYYCTDQCNHDNKNEKDSSIENSLVMMFESKEEAARSGYWPCFMMGK